METRTIGSLSASVVGVGCNNFGGRLDADGTAAVVDAALDADINFFDTADVYGRGQSEEFLGRALGPRRRHIVIATKFGNRMEGQGQGASAAYLEQAVEASLRRLGTDYIDLYQLHRPDPDVPIEETLGALDGLVRAGKVRAIGSSNFSVDQIQAAEAAAHGRARFVSVQNQYNLIQREPEHGVLAACEHAGIAFLPYSPLADGLLTGKYRQGRPAPEGTRLTGNPRAAKTLNDENLALVESLLSFVEARGHTLLELAFAWLLGRPIVASVIAGAMSSEQVRANAAAAAWRLSPTDLAEIDRLCSQGA